MRTAFMNELTTINDSFQCTVMGILLFIIWTDLP